jgi:HAD superfamily hydrolase (TIGR01549 family)
MKYCWEETNNHFGINKSFTEFSKLIGLPLTSIIDTLEISNGQQIINHYKNLSYNNLDKLNLKKGTLSNIETLSRFYKISIYTSKTWDRVEKIISLYFDSINFNSIITSDDVTKSKPDSEGLFKICNLVDSSIDQSIYIGDTNYDFLAAKNAGMDFVYASWGYGDVKNAKYEIDSIKELYELIT